MLKPRYSVGKTAFIIIAVLLAMGLSRILASATVEKYPEVMPYTVLRIFYAACIGAILGLPLAFIRPKEADNEK